ncbi:MAG: ATP-binding protein [Oceanipulchritudo sp.]
MEIVVPLEVSAEEESLLNMHSVLNVINIINLELLEISGKLSRERAVLDLVEEISDVAQSLCDPEKAFEAVSHIDDLMERIRTTLVRVGKQHDPVILETCKVNFDNLESIFSIVRIRAREIVSRKARKEEWVQHEVDHLNGNFHAFLKAVEVNSKGRYRIVDNVAEHQDGFYLVDFKVSSSNGTSILMPPVFQDVMRDILANARKYTPPGGEIKGGLFFDEKELRYVVTDTGCGIPAGEIQSVVKFGRRAQNALDFPTRGGGFGLTKAYYVTRRYNGRMWIDSETGPASGTRVEIRIPLPA